MSIEDATKEWCARKLEIPIDRIKSVEFAVICDGCGSDETPAEFYTAIEIRLTKPTEWRELYIEHDVAGLVREISTIIQDA